MTQRFSLGSGIGYSKSYPEFTKKDEIFDPSDATHPYQMREMTTCLIANNNKQVENFNKLYDNISGVKEQVNNIQYATDGVVEEQINIQWETSLLETSLQQIISNTPKTPSSTLKLRGIYGTFTDK